MPGPGVITGGRRSPTLSERFVGANDPDVTPKAMARASSEDSAPLEMAQTPRYVDGPIQTVQCEGRVNAGRGERVWFGVRCRAVSVRAARGLPSRLRLASGRRLTRWGTNVVLT